VGEHTWHQKEFFNSLLDSPSCVLPFFSTPLTDFEVEVRLMDERS